MKKTLAVFRFLKLIGARQTFKRLRKEMSLERAADLHEVLKLRGFDHLESKKNTCP